jgi:hypothetical protein
LEERDQRGGGKVGQFDAPSDIEMRPPGIFH